LGDIHVAGMDLPHVREKLRQEYSKILREPEIRLELKEFEKPYFIAGGEVGKPGKYELRGDTTVAQAVSVAGGFTDVAKHSRVLLFRRVSTEWVEVKKINMKKMLANADLHEDLLVRPGDLIYVPVSGIGKLKASLMPRIGATIRPY
jgi:polysaccharide biosynthesis/export protein